MIKLSKSAEKPFDFQRGTSIRLPLVVKYNNDTPFDLTKYTVHFTLKADKNQLTLGGDWDYHDDRAYIIKDVTPDAPETGRVNIDLSPKNTWIPEGLYFFDVELVHTEKKSVVRLCTLQANIIPGPTNRTVEDSGDEPDIIEDLIEVKLLEDKSTIIAIVPLMADPPEHLTYGVIPEPKYMVTYDELNDPDHNWPIFQSFNCREEYPFDLDFNADHTEYSVHWIHDTHRPLEPAVEDIRILDNTLTIKLKDEYSRVYVYQAGEYYDPVTINGMHPITKAPQIFTVPASFSDSYKLDITANEYSFELVDEVKGGHIRLHFTSGHNSTQKLLINIFYKWPYPDILSPKPGYMFGEAKYYNVEGEL